MARVLVTLNFTRRMVEQAWALDWRPQWLLCTWRPRPHLRLRARAAESPGKGFDDSNEFVATFLITLVFLAMFATIPAAFLDYFDDPAALLAIYWRVSCRGANNLRTHVSTLCFPRRSEDPNVPGARHIAHGGASLRLAVCSTVTLM